LLAAIVDRYNDATRRALANEELRSKLVEQGYDLWLGSPKTLSDRASKELAMWATVTKGIQVD
jgi:tripartite-type tricarboxylate transporter receptor subunit TctC